MSVDSSVRSIIACADEPARKLDDARTANGQCFFSINGDATKYAPEMAVLDMSLDGHLAQDHLVEAITHLTAASEAAKRMSDQDMLARLIDAVLLHAGRELARKTGAEDPSAFDDI